MSIRFLRRSLELTPAEWRNIENLARQLKITAPTGSHAGQPSWRSLIKAIADDEIELQAKAPDDPDLV